MTFSIIAGFVWLIVANLRAMFPSKDHHWRFAYVMMAIGLPILILLFLENGALVATVFLLAAMWIMRWPVIYLGRWIKKVSGYDPG